MSKFKTVSKQERKAQVQMRTTNTPSFIKQTCEIQEYIPKDGDNEIRLVPPLADEKHGDQFGLNIRIHYMNNTAFVQPNTFDKTIKDPLYPQFLRKKSQGADDDVVRAFRGTPRTFVYVLDVLDDFQLKYWLVPYSVMPEILKIAKNRRTGELIPLEDPEKGRIIFFNRKGTGINTKYSAFSLDEEPCPLDESIGDELHLFEDIIIVPTVEEVERHIKNFDDSIDDDFDDDADEVEPEELDDDIPEFENKGMAYDDESEEDDSDTDEDEDEPEEEQKETLAERMKRRKAKQKQRNS